MTPLAEIIDYDGLVVALRARADQLEVSRETISDLAGLPDRYASKLLSLRHVRRIGLESLGPLLDTLGVRLVLIEDGDALFAQSFAPRQTQQVAGSPPSRGLGEMPPHPVG